jgi:DNA-directed RNA polymerase specialized sigma24 family protein
MSPLALRRYRAERLLHKEFSGLRSRVLAVVGSQLRTKGVTLDAADLEACYAQAWHGLYATVLGGEEVENPSAWLVLVTFRRAIDESRSASRSQVGGEAPRGAFDLDLPWERQRAVSDPDLAGELDDRARLRQVFEGLRTRLSERECEAASLCYLQGFSRAEAAGRMGISESRMRKLMEGSSPGRPGVAGKVGELLDTIERGGWCEQQASLMRALAFGILDPDGERHALAMAHCRECPACRAHVASLRGLASVLPPLPLLSPHALAGGMGATATGTGASLGRAGATAAKGAPRAGGSLGGGLTSTGWRGLGGRATSMGWGGLGGSLATKLALMALVVLGSGYAVLGGRAHGSPPAARTGVVQSPVLGGALSQALFSTRGRSSGEQRSTKRSFASHARSSSSRSHLAGKVASPEFGPERALSERAAPSTPTSSLTRSPRNPSRAPHEFGIE